MTSSPDPTDTDRRHHSRGRDRRREAWRAFRHAYPTFLRVTAALFLLLVAFDIWLVARHFAYRYEIGRLRAGMTDAERRKSDLLISAEQDKLRVALELAKRQAQWDPKLHLSVSVDSGRMYLLRDGALLRDMVVALPPAQTPRVKGDTSTTIPLGQRTIVDVQGGATPELVLNGGTRIYALADSVRRPAQTATDSGGVAAPAPTIAVTPGDVRASANDLNAMLPNLHPGMSVYFY